MNFNTRQSKLKRGNGTEYLQHQHRLAMAYNLMNLKGQLNGRTFENLDYEEIHNKFNNYTTKVDRKDKELECVN
jgi:hypothetical protein